MAWTKLDDGFTDHPKVAPLSDPAFRSFVGGLCFANRYLTDGVLPGHATAKIATAKVRKELVGAGLWNERDDGGVSIHDFLEYNRDAETVKAERRANAERQKRWRDQHRNGVTDGVSHGGSNGVSNGTPTRPDPSKKKPPGDASRRDEVWDTLEELFQPVADKTSAHGKRNKACGDLRRHGATAETIRLAHKRWFKTFEGAACTDVALAKHFPQLTAGLQLLTPPCFECGIGGGHHAVDCSFVTEKVA
jgi:hypothetical protein